ncbi:MAG: Mandelate racemase/muconate lactonizing protein, partial [Verrucomicrobia bacterium]|nr:Mandelate racemase/muconate lactonizing protein [Verrucomicrobiota bacterium]
MRITEMHVTPIALGDPPLLNAAGLHAPYALRTVVELVTDNGLHGLAEVPGSVAVEQALRDAREIVVGADPINWNALRAALATRFKGESTLARGNKPWDSRTFVQVFSALDVACLDLQGRAFDVPVAMLLGGVVREQVPYSAYLFYKDEGAGGELGFGVDPKATGWAAA